MVIASTSEMNIVLNNAHVSWFTAMPRLVPCVCWRNNVISALYVPARGLNPMECAAMKARADKDAGRHAHG
jgi:hypothetical protein